MTGNWERRKLVDCCVFNPESMKADWPHVWLRYIDISSVGEGIQSEPFKLMLRQEAPSRAQRLVACGDSLLSTVRPNRRSMLWLDSVSDDVVASTGFAVLRAKPEVMVPRFLYYTVFNRSFTDYLVTREKGAAYPAVSTTDIGDAEINVPSLSEQEAIAAVLGTLDDKIELNRRMNATLEAIARALFQSWFVDFDPVRAKEEGRPPVGLDESTAALFPDSFDGETPKGWQRDRIGEFSDFQNGYAFKSKDWQPEGIPVVKIGSVKPGIVDLSGCTYVAPASVEGLDRFKLSSGDILVGMTGYPGEVGVVPLVEPAPYLNQRVGRVSPKEGSAHFYSWIHQNLRQAAFKAFAESRAHGSAQANVSGGALMEFPVVFPGEDIVRAFETICRPLVDRILRNDAESSALARIRDELLPKLLNGDLSDRLAELTENQ